MILERGNNVISSTARPHAFEPIRQDGKQLSKYLWPNVEMVGGGGRGGGNSELDIYSDSNYTYRFKGRNVPPSHSGNAPGTIRDVPLSNTWTSNVIALSDVIVMS